MPQTLYEQVRNHFIYKISSEPSFIASQGVRNAYMTMFADLLCDWEGPFKESLIEMLDTQINQIAICDQNISVKWYIKEVLPKLYQEAQLEQREKDPT